MNHIISIDKINVCAYLITVKSFELIAAYVKAWPNKLPNNKASAGKLLIKYTRKSVFKKGIVIKSVYGAIVRIANLLTQFMFSHPRTIAPLFLKSLIKSQGC